MLMDEDALVRTIRRLAAEIAERENPDNLVLVGIKTRGFPIAKRIARELSENHAVEVPVGAVDITFYRDDLSTIAEIPQVKGSELPFEVEGKVVILCDDVLYTGRTARAALEELLDYGRYKAVRLCVIVDRGWRELPICPDYVGRKIDTLESEVVEVRLREVDGEDSVWICER